jgi:hypothetical protein
MTTRTTEWREVDPSEEWDRHSIDWTYADGPIVRWATIDGVNRLFLYEPPALDVEAIGKGNAAFYLRAALDWIDAIPKEVADRLPAMPGFDRDEAEAAIAREIWEEDE